MSAPIDCFVTRARSASSVARRPRGCRDSVWTTGKWVGRTAPWPAAARPGSTTSPIIAW